MHRRITGRLVIATHNPGKLAEMRELLAPHGVEAVSAGELGLGEPEETGQTFRANAAIKAIAAAKAAQLPAFADDSGLVVDALDGAPGIYSARWAGEGKDFMAAMSRIERLLQERGATTPDKRKAHFVSALCVAWPDGHLEEVEARADGTLVWPPRGTAGFGYDPAFLPDGHVRTFGEMTSIEKARPAAARPRPVAPGACLRQTGGDLSWLAPNAITRSETAFGVYVHWPFCLSKCPYCDFNSHVRHAPIDEERFARAFAREIETTAARAPDRTVTSIFLGGGTPSLMQPQTVGAILDSIGKHWRVADNVEVTLEANPTSVEATRFRGYRAAGVNRVSLGVQALDDASLKALGRLHSAREALDAVAIARTAFDRYSFDLIYARPDQTPQMWADELKLAISEAAEHLSLYQLTIEEGTPFFGLHAAGKLKTPDEAVARALYDVTQEVCAHHGLPAYEISNHARAGAECQHNLVYWRGDEYAGIGPGAHGRLDIDGIRHAIATEKRPEAWLMRVEANGHGVVTDDDLNSEERADEFLLMGLRLAEGIDPKRYAALVRPRTRPEPDRRAARGRRHHRRRRRQAARDERRFPGARCGRRGSRGVKAVVPAKAGTHNHRR